MSSVAKVEFEAMFYPVDKEIFRKLLQSKNATLTHPERKMRRAVIDQRFYPQIKCQFLRVRDEGDKVTLSAKNHADPGGKMTDKKEISITVSDFETTLDILRQVNIDVTNYQENKREDWVFDGAEISIDTWPGLEPHIEIEGDSEEKVKQIATSLGFDWAKKIITSRIEIYAQLYGKTIQEVLDMSAKLTFDENPFANLPIVGEIDYSIQTAQ